MPFVTPPEKIENKPEDIADPKPEFTPPSLDFLTPSPTGVLPPLANPDFDSINLDLISWKEADEKPVAIKTVHPRLGSNHRNFSGTIYAEFIIESDGSVRSVTVIESPDMAITNAVVLALRQWRFEPGKKEGKAVRVIVRQPLRFD